MHVSDATLDSGAPPFIQSYPLAAPHSNKLTTVLSSFFPEYVGPGVQVSNFLAATPAPTPSPDKKEKSGASPATVGVLSALAGLVCGAGLAYAFMGQSNTARSSSSLHQPLIQGSKGQDL